MQSKSKTIWKIKLCLWIYNYPPVAQLVRVSDWHSEDPGVSPGWTVSQFHSCMWKLVLMWKFIGIQMGIIVYEEVEVSMWKYLCGSIYAEVSIWKYLCGSIHVKVSMWKYPCGNTHMEVSMWKWLGPWLTVLKQEVVSKLEVVNYVQGNHRFNFLVIISSRIMNNIVHSCQ